MDVKEKQIVEISTHLYPRIRHFCILSSSCGRYSYSQLTLELSGHIIHRTAMSNGPCPSCVHCPRFRPSNNAAFFHVRALPYEVYCTFVHTLKASMKFTRPRCASGGMQKRSRDHTRPCVIEKKRKSSDFLNSLMMSIGYIAVTADLSRPQGAFDSFVSV